MLRSQKILFRLGVLSMFRSILLFIKLALICSVPVYASTFAQTAQSSHFELTAIGCVAAWILGSIAGVLYPMPEDSKITNPWLKLCLSTLAGLVALVYTLQDGEGLKSISVIWVGLVSLIAPSTVENAKALFVSFLNRRFGGQ